MVVAVLFVSAFGAFSGGGSGTAKAASTANWASLAYKAASPANPIKGLMPFGYDAAPYGFHDANNLPVSMVHYYVPLNQVMVGSNKFDWSEVEARLNAAQQQGAQSVLRFYIDYPGRAYAMPAFLTKIVQTTVYTDYDNAGQSFIPNYNDPRLMAALDRFIAAFGAKYDGDVRIGAIELGLLGFWGEWHTYQSTCSCDVHMANVTNEDRILNDYTKAFKNTKLMVRYALPDIIPSPDKQPMGYHDDSFAYATIMQDSSTSWYFTGRMATNGGLNAWKQYPIGGEVYPPVQTCILTGTLSVPPKGCTSKGQDWTDSVNGTHLSFVKLDHAFADMLTAKEMANATLANQKMGYEYYVSQVSLPKTVSGQPLQVGVNIRNTGVAPFYYNWPVQLRVVGGATKATWTTSWQISDIEPGAAPTQFAFVKANPGLSAGTYTVELGVPNPMKGGLPLRFADATQDKTDSGWLTLGTITVS